MSQPANQKRVLLLLPFLAIAAWLAFFGDKTPPGEAPVTSPARSVSGSVQSDVPASASADASTPEAAVPVGFARDGLRALLDQDQPVNLFNNGRPPEPEHPQAAAPETPQPAFRFVGRMLRDGRWNVFLDSDNATYVVTPGAMIKDYRVDAVQSHQVQVTHLPTKSTHIIPIEGDQ